VLRHHAEKQPGVDRSAMVISVIYSVSSNLLKVTAAFDFVSPSAPPEAPTKKAEARMVIAAPAMKESVLFMIAT
jgi:hypothetical protein